MGFIVIASTKSCALYKTNNQAV